MYLPVCRVSISIKAILILMLFGRVLTCMYIKFLITVTIKHAKCVYYLYLYMGLCTYLSECTYQLNQKRVNNIQFEMKSAIKMLEKNYINILRSI